MTVGRTGQPRGAATGGPTCRSCGAGGLERVLDLGSVPAGDALMPTASQAATAPAWPLRTWLCTACLLLQLDDHGPDESEASMPAYRSPALQRHADGFAGAVLDRLAANGAGAAGPPRILEVASHGGYVQDAFEARGARTLIAEASPARVDAARDAGRSVVMAQVDATTAGDLVRAAGGPFDAVVDEFLLAHLRDPVAFLAGIRALLAPQGLAALELAHAGPMIALAEYDSVRHGHMSYFTLHALEVALRRAGLAIVDVESLPLYGGSLRAWVCPAASRGAGDPPAVAEWRAAERAAGLDSRAAYTAFGGAVERATGALRDYLQTARADGRTVAGYGAPSRATTLLVGAGITAELLPFTVDQSPAKHGGYLPGCAVPVLPVEDLLRSQPDDVLVLTWDIAAEVVEQLPAVRAWGGRFVVPLPSLHVVP